MFNVRKPKVGVKWVKLNPQVQYNKNIHRKKDTKNSSLLLPKKTHYKTTAAAIIFSGLAIETVVHVLTKLKRRVVMVFQWIVKL